MGARRKARECALMMLYGADLAAHGAEVAIERFWASFGDNTPLDPPPPYLAPTGRAEPSIDGNAKEMRQYAETLVRGVVDARDEIDETIRKISLHWRLERMACVDRNVLRLGVYEITRLGNEVPRKVAINEAVEVAKIFGTAESNAFVNGILDRIGK